MAIAGNGFPKLPWGVASLCLALPLVLTACAQDPALKAYKDGQQALEPRRDNLNAIQHAQDGTLHNAAALNIRGAAQGGSGNLDGALKDFSAAVAIDPVYYQAYSNRGLVYLKMGDLARAEADFSKALELAPDYGAAYVGRGDVRRLGRKLGLALEDYDKAAGLRPQDPRVFHKRALVRQAQGQHDLALADFTAAIELNPKAAPPYHGRALSHLSMNQPERAMQDLDMAVTRNSSYSEAWAVRGALLEKNNELKAAFASYRKALAADRTNEMAQAGLDRISRSTASALN